jgi:hypothetical protein
MNPVRGRVTKPLAGGLFVTLVLSLAATTGCRRTLRADPVLLAAAPPDLLQRLRATPYNYFRFVNHEWTARVCEIFAADIPRQPVVQLHGDAHVEQYAYNSDAWGLDDFDDSTRGPALVDIVRFLGSIELAVRERGWTGDRDRMVDRFFAGYRHGLAEPLSQPSKPDIVRWMQAETPAMSNEQLLAWAENSGFLKQMPSGAVVAAMQEFAKVVRSSRPDLAADYFEVVRANWLKMGVGSASSSKVLMRLKGPSDDPNDDVLLEAKAIRTLEGLSCVDLPERPFRIVTGSQQLGRLKHTILAAGPEVSIPQMTLPRKDLAAWWIRSWEPSYREVGLDKLRSPDDLGDIVYDSGMQLAAGSVHPLGGAIDLALDRQLLASTNELEPRLRKASRNLVEELLKGWRELQRHQ